MYRPQAVKKQKSSRARILRDGNQKNRTDRPQDDVRLESQRGALLAWADRYAAANYKTLDEQEAKSSKKTNVPSTFPNISNTRSVIPKQTELTVIQENEPLSLDSLALVTPLKNRTPIVAQTQVSPSRLEPRLYAAVYHHIHIFEPVPGVGVSFEQAVENAVHNIQYNRTGERISSEITNPRREYSPLIKVAKVRIIRFP